MSSPNYRESIAFPVFNDEQIGRIRDRASCSKHSSGDVLLRAGEKNFKFYIVGEGEIEIIDDTGKEPRQIALHKKGEFTGDIDMLTGRPAIFTARCVTDCEVLEMDSADFRVFLNEVPDIGEILLKAMMMRREILLESEFVGWKVYGNRFDGETHRVKDFLARNKVPYRWFDPEQDPETEQLLENLGFDLDGLPLVITASGEHLTIPSNALLAEKSGLKTVRGSESLDLVVVGAGPAGLAAAVYGASEGLRTLILEREGPGGQAGSSMKIENYLGFPTGLTGAELAERAYLQAQKFGAEFSIPSEVSSVVCEGALHEIILDDGEVLNARAVLAATGAQYRKLEATNCEEFEGKGIFYAATPIEAQGAEGKEAVIVGGGNSAGQAAVFLSRIAKKVYVVIRGDDLYSKMSSYLARRLERTENIEIVSESQVELVEGNGWLGQVSIGSKSGSTLKVDCGHLFVFIGAIPHSSWLPKEVEMDDRGFVCAGQKIKDRGLFGEREPLYLETSCPGLFVAGDLRQGSIKRVASAVGEGSMCVAFVHEYLSLVR